LEPLAAVERAAWHQVAVVAWHQEQQDLVSWDRSELVELEAWLQLSGYIYCEGGLQ